MSRRCRKQPGLVCIDCAGYAPRKGDGQPMWVGPRCTRCACAQYVAQTGCDPAQAELLLMQARAQVVLDTTPASSQVQEVGTAYAMLQKQGPLQEQPVYRVAMASQSCNLLELLIAFTGREATARALLAKFGSIKTLATAPIFELQSVSGVGPKLAAQIRAAAELFGRRVAQATAPRTLLSMADVAEVLYPLLHDKEQEYLYALTLNTRNHLIGAPVEVYHGSVNTTLLRTGEVFREAIRRNAVSVIVAHNHPSGDPSPSLEDIAVSRALWSAGKMLDIDLLDHVIIGEGHCVSLKERGLF